MAEGLLRLLLDRSGIGATVGSAGLLPGGAPARPEAVLAMARRGVDISGHLSSTVDADLVRATPLVLGMARHHVRELCIGCAAPLDRTYTLKELVRRGELGGGRRPGEPVATWLGRLGAGRRPADLLGDDPGDDVPDPVGRPRAAYEAVADELDDQLRRLVPLVAGTPPAPTYADPAGDRRPDRDPAATGPPAHRSPRR